jgi:catechol 2,3-dioxygenase-like lactoylglutathione lyase family enzyme
MARGSIHHLGLTVRAVERSEAAFYAPVLGFLGYERVVLPGNATFWRDPKRGPTLHLVPAPASGVAPPERDHCAFSVESRERVDRLHELLVARSIEVLSAPAEYPHFGNGHYAVFFKDPDGRLFEVLHRPSAVASNGIGQ